MQAELVVIDHVSLIGDPGDNETHRLDRITRRTKQMAKDLDVAVLMLCQLNRESDKRTDHKPQLADLRDSGGLEQNADVVLMPYRPDYYDARIQPDVDGCVPFSVFVRKERNGENHIEIQMLYDLAGQAFFGIGRNWQKEV